MPDKTDPPADDEYDHMPGAFRDELRALGDIARALESLSPPRRARAVLLAALSVAPRIVPDATLAALIEAARQPEPAPRITSGGGSYSNVPNEKHSVGVVTSIDAAIADMQRIALGDTPRTISQRRDTQPISPAMYDALFAAPDAVKCVHCGCDEFESSTVASARSVIRVDMHCKRCGAEYCTRK